MLRTSGVLVVYPGSVERTSFAEKDEPKGFYEIMIAEGEPDERLCRKLTASFLRSVFAQSMSVQPGREFFLSGPRIDAD